MSPTRCRAQGKCYLFHPLCPADDKEDKSREENLSPLKRGRKLPCTARDGTAVGRAAGICTGHSGQCPSSGEGTGWRLLAQGHPLHILC